MKKTLTIALILVVTVLLAAPSHALSPTRVGNKNFERGWSMLIHGDRDGANEQFVTGAKAFAEALGEDPRSSYTDFTSNLTKAGMTFYYAGRYQEAVEVMGEVYGKDNRVWEAPIYAALAYAAMGDRENTLEWLKKYRESLATQYIISNAVVEQEKALADGVDIAAVAKELDDAVVQQFWSNTGQKQSAMGNEKCGSSFWWRYAFKPCAKGRFVGGYN